MLPTECYRNSAKQRDEFRDALRAMGKEYCWIRAICSSRKWGDDAIRDVDKFNALEENFRHPMLLLDFSRQTPENTLVPTAICERIGVSNTKYNPEKFEYLEWEPLPTSSS